MRLLWPSSLPAPRLEPDPQWVAHQDAVEVLLLAQQVDVWWVGEVERIFSCCFVFGGSVVGIKA